MLFILMTVLIKKMFYQKMNSYDTFFLEINNRLRVPFRATNY